MRIRLLNRCRLGVGIPLALLLVVVTGCLRDVVPEDRNQRTEDTERQQIAEFWKAYREATRLRVAGDLESSMAAYEEALRRDSTHEDALYYLGNVALELGRRSRAEQVWTILAEVNPASSRAYIQLGNLFMCDPSAPEFDLSMAARFFRQAVRLNREETGALLRLGQVHLVSGRPDSAADYLDHVLTSDPSNREASFGRAYADWRMGKEAAVTTFVDVIGRATSDEKGTRFSSEGDTKEGRGAPMLAPGTRCPIFDDLYEGIGASKPGPAEVIDRFEDLAERIAMAGD